MLGRASATGCPKQPAHTGHVSHRGTPLQIQRVWRCRASLGAILHLKVTHAVFCEIIIKEQNLKL